MIDNQELHRFELTENGLLVFATYSVRGDSYAINHVEADPALRDTGAAGRLMQAIAGWARTNGKTLLPRCSYAIAWMQRHPENKDLTT